MARTRSSTVQGSLRRMAVASGAKAIWPKSVARATDPELAALELERYELLWQRRAPDDWTEHELCLCARAAAIEAMIQREVIQLQAEGGLDVDSKGLPRMNPRVSTLGALQSTSSILLRSIGFAQPVVDKRQLHAAGVANRAAVQTINRAKADQLLAGYDDGLI